MKRKNGFLAIILPLPGRYSPFPITLQKSPLEFHHLSILEQSQLPSFPLAELRNRKLVLAFTSPEQGTHFVIFPKLLLPTFPSPRVHMFSVTETRMQHMEACCSGSGNSYSISPLYHFSQSFLWKPFSDLSAPLLLSIDKDGTLLHHQKGCFLPLRKGKSNPRHFPASPNPSTSNYTNKKSVYE